MAQLDAIRPKELMYWLNSAFLKKTLFLRTVLLNCTHNIFVTADTILQYVQCHVSSGYAEIQPTNTPSKLKTQIHVTDDPCERC